MKNTSRVFFIAFLPLIFLCTTCKKPQYKYPEDPGTTKITPKERIRGGWQINAYTLNGKDIIPDLENIFADKFKISSVVFGFSIDPKEVNWTFNISGTDLFGEYPDDHFEQPNYLIIDNDNNCCNFILSKWFITPFKYTPNARAQWTITKLYGQDLNLVLAQDTGEYKLFLKKK